METIRETEFADTIVIGAGQAGLSAGYHLARRGIPFLVLDANEEVGDSWRNRWDSLRLFTPAKYDSLDGMPFPAKGHYFPRKDEMADYLESYAAHFGLPVRTGTRVDGLYREEGRFVITSGERRFEANNVVVAMAKYQQPRVPAFAGHLDPGITQLHAIDYRSPSQLREGGVLIVGAANSGADIAMELANEHHVWLSGRHPGHVPFRVEGTAGRLLVRLVLRGIFHRVMTVRTPMRRRMRAKVKDYGLPLVRVKPSDLAAAGVERVARVASVASQR